MDTTQFVSRGGIKLQAALDHFKLKVADLTVLDVGSSTGGFIDCLLQNGVSKVYAVDTCYGELAWKLRNDKRVVVMERTNILHLQQLPLVRHPGVRLRRTIGSHTRSEMLSPAKPGSSMTLAMTMLWLIL